jgi:hypothetical protein
LWQNDKVDRAARKKHECKTDIIAAYCNPHLRDSGLSGSPCPAQSEGQRKLRAAKSVSLGDKLSIDPTDQSSNRSLTNSAAAAPATAGDDLPETFAAIGSTLDKTNSQMTSQPKTINKHFAVPSRSKTFKYLPV